jgi:aspartate/tyrosine/aromatic aminotransferase
MVISDDIFYDLNFDAVLKLYKQVKKDKQRYRVQLMKGMYTSVEGKKYIGPYINILNRNQE